MILEKGTEIWIPVQSGDVVELTGYYVAQVAGVTDPWLRNSLIYEFLKRDPLAERGLSQGVPL